MEAAAMSMRFLDHIKAVEDHRIAGMTTYPLDDVLLAVLVGLLCQMEDFDEMVMFGEEQLAWLRRFLPFRNGVAPAQSEVAPDFGTSGLVGRSLLRMAWNGSRA